MSLEENEFSHILYEAKMYIKTYRFTSGDQLFTNLIRANHAIHLRNLAYFFGEKRHSPNWHYSDFVADENMVQPIPADPYGSIMRYCNGAEDHLCSDRVSKSYKARTNESEDKAFPILIEKILELLKALDESVSQEYSPKWSNPSIQDSAIEVRKLCKLHASGGGCIISGCCQLILFDDLGEAEYGSSRRFFEVSEICTKPHF